MPNHIIILEVDAIPNHIDAGECDGTGIRLRPMFLPPSCRYLLALHASTPNYCCKQQEPDELRPMNSHCAFTCQQLASYS